MSYARHQGFTILELLIAIVVVSIFLTLAIPSFQAAIQNNRLTSAANGFVTAMQFARSEAISRRAPISVCGSSDAASCDDEWELGWIVFVDDNDEGSGTALVGEVIRVWPAVDGDMTNDGDEPDFVRFLPNGAVDAAAGTTYPVTFNLEMPSCSGNSARVIEIQRTGRVAAHRVACG